MVRRFQTEFDRGNDVYIFGLKWDDTELEEGKISADISVTHHLREEDRTDTHELQVSLSSEGDGDSDAPVLSVDYTHNGKTEHEPIMRFDEVYIVDQVLEKIPAHFFGGGDPITGCLIRSGLSVTIGQLIDCRNNTAEVRPWIMKRMYALGSCLKHSFPGMCIKLAYKTAKCIFKGGL